MTSMEKKDFQILKSLYRWKREIYQEINEFIKDYPREDILMVCVDNDLKIEFIMHIRNFSGMTLKETKDMVDEVWGDKDKVLEFMKTYT